MTAGDRSGADIIRELHAVIVPVSDLARSVAWYGDALGLAPRRVEAGFLAVLGTGGVTNVCLYVPEAGTERPGYPQAGSFPNFRAHDLEAAHRHLTDRGVRCTEIGGGGAVSFFTCYDPDGNRIDVCAYGPDWLD